MRQATRSTRMGRRVQASPSTGTRGVEPFTIRDEWYYNIRFPEGQSGIEPCWGPPRRTKPAAPPTQRRMPVATRWWPGRSIDPTAVAASVSPAGTSTRTGATKNFRKLVLNALLWTAKAEVPAAGAASKVTAEELKESLDPKGKK